MDTMNDFYVSTGFPTFISPKVNLNQENTFNFLKIHKKSLQALLLKNGGLVFRGFPVQHANDFSKFIMALDLGKFVNYIGGDSPRDKVEHQIYTSTEAPPSLHIPLHQELSFSKNAPRHIYFYCEIAPKLGGETIIADARLVYEAIDPKIKALFQQKSLTYISHYYYKSKIMSLVNRWQRSHKSWIEVFETEDKNEVEQKCLQNDFKFQWLKHNWLKVQQTMPAIIKHPFTKEIVWFNQAHLYDFNPKLLGFKRYLGAKLFYFNPNTCLHKIQYADGSRIARKALYHILDTLKQNTVKFTWQTGDIMVLDNILAMHGRAPFQGKRRVLTALTS